MREMRKVEKAVKEYEKLLTQNPQNAKEYKEDYLKDVELLIVVVETYIEHTEEVFQTWCDTSVKVWEEPTNNIFQKIKRAIGMAISNHYLNLLSKEIAKAGRFQEPLALIKGRFEQFQYFC